MHRPAHRSMIERLEVRRLLSTTYYVAPAATTVNLSTAGTTENTPIRLSSVAEVNAQYLKAGDRVLFQSGQSFAGSLQFGTDGTGPLTDDAGSFAVGTFDVVGGLPSTADPGRATLQAGNADGVSVLNVGGVSVSDLTVVGSGAQAAASFNGLEFDTNLSGDVKLAGAAVSDVEVSGFGRYGISVGGSNGKSGYADVRVERVNVHHNTLGGIETHGVFSSTATTYANARVYVGYSTVHDNPGYAGSPNHSGDGIVLSDAAGVVIERNEAYENGSANTHVGGPVGIWVWDVDNALIQNNESHHNRTNSTADGGGFDFDGGVTNSVMQYNYSHDNDGPGYGVYQFAGARPFHDNVVRYNVSANDARKNSYGAIDFWNGNGSNGISNVGVYNNTVYVTPSTKTQTVTTTKKGQTTTTTTTTKLGDPRALRFISGTTNVSIRNNVFQTTGGAMLAQIDANQTNLQIQGNDWWSSGAAFSLKSFAKVYTSFTAFVSGTGYEKLGTATVGKNLDPQMVAPAAVPTVGVANIDPTWSAAGGYQLAAGSPLRGSGLNLWSLFNTNPGGRDFYGTNLPGTKDVAAGFAYSVGAAQ